MAIERCIPIRLKAGVDIDRLRSPMWRAIYVAATVYARTGAAELTITSGLDGEHSAESLHYEGLGVDLRVWSLDDPAEVARDIAVLLGPRYDVVVEKTHIHMEYDPR